MKVKSKREKQAERIHANKEYLQCPLCASAINVIDNSSIVCANHHSFDIAKQGYAFLLPKRAQTNYTKELFEQRRKINIDTLFYKQFQQQIATLIDSYIPKTPTPPRIIDMGTGEGSHLEMITSHMSKELKRSSVGIGIDISKEGIVHAAKQNDEQIWLVADLAHSPIASGSMDIILNILSPSNYNEFARVCSKNGAIIKSIPGNAYMQEMRRYFHTSASAVHSNERVRTHFADHFDTIDIVHIKETHPLTIDYRRALAAMSPLTWEASSTKIESFISEGPSEITIDLDILVGKGLAHAHA